MDDWRAFRRETVGSLELRHLFWPANDTLYPVGAALDALAFKFLNGNSVAYQFLSMTAVLGALLALQWQLLGTVLPGRFSRSLCFLLTLLMLQPGTYWGAQDLAYHQALPLVFILSALWVVLNAKIQNIYMVPALGVLGFLAGFSYVSGAFALLPVAIVLFAFARLVEAPERRRLTLAGFSLLVPAVITGAAQGWVIAIVQKGTHRSDIPMAYPWEADFWLVFMGKIGRSLMLPVSLPVLSLVMTVLVFIAAAAVLVWSVYFTVKQKNLPMAGVRGQLIYAALFGVVFVYLLLIAAGRANHRPAGLDSPLDIFVIGFQRFHFFWATILWPWLACSGGLALQGWLNSTSVFRRPHIIAASGLPLLLIAAGAFDHAEYFRNITGKIKEPGLRCLVTEVARGGPVRCPAISPGELARQVVYAKTVGASFTRFLNFSTVLYDSNSLPILFRLSEDGTRSLAYNNVAVASEDGVQRYQAGNDPMILFKAGEGDAMERCKVLDVRARVRVGSTEQAQLFFKQPHQKGFTEKNSTKASLRASPDYQEVSFELHSPEGFSDDLRFDPIRMTGIFELKELEVRCIQFRR